MGRKSKETSLDVRNLIIHHYKLGKTEKSIAEIVQKPRTTIHYIIKKFKTENTVINKERTGRPRKLTEIDERRIVREVRKDPKSNATVLAKFTEEHIGVSVTSQTIRNVLKNMTSMRDQPERNHTFRRKIGR